jgi:hypothetical protein
MHDQNLEALESPSNAPKARVATSRWVAGWALLLAALGLGTLGLLSMQSDQRSRPNEPLTAPPLATRPARCDGVPQNAGARATLAAQTAEAKIARYPYAPVEGPRALQQLEDAARCLAISGDARGAKRADERAQSWRAHLERDYRDHLVRYRRGVLTAQPSVVRLEVGLLLKLLADQQGPFINYLRSTQLSLAASDNTHKQP